MENPVLDAIAARRSIRGYKPSQITEAQLQAIVDAGLQAPSAVNAQPWHFTVVQNGALLTRINEAFRKVALQSAPPERRESLADPAYSVFYHTPTVIFISCPSTLEKPYAQTDTGIAIQNMALAAHSLGLGSVILGMPRMAFQGEEAADLRRVLAFPDGYEYCLSIAIGIPDTTKDAHPIQPDRVTLIR